MKKEIAKEYPPAAETEYIYQIVDELKSQMNKLWPNGTRMMRQAESKMHGCLRAQFTVLKDIDPKYRVGVFAEPKTFDAILRFSNAATGITNDAKKDQRGLAMKLIGVEGEKLMIDEHGADTQDFIGLNYETFVAKSVKEFNGLLKAFTSGKFKLLLYALNPFHWGLLRRVSKAASIIGSLLEQNYWSTTAFQLGDGQAMKFMFRSTLYQESEVPAKPSPDFLKERMSEFLKESDVSFDFLVQLQTNADKMPIEDPTVKWSSEFVKIGILHIPKQHFDEDKNRQFGEALSFNPWHSLPVHRPLGGLNRARLAIYGQLSTFRNKTNGIEPFEPRNMNFKLPE